MRSEALQVGDTKPSYIARADRKGVPPGYKRTEVGVIPEDWRIGPLSTVCAMKSGESITAARIDSFSQYPCYGGNGLRGYTDRFTHSGRFTLIGRQGALCGNAIGVSGEFFASEHAVVVTPLQQTEIAWLTYVLGSMHLNQYSESSAQPGLSVVKLLGLNIGYPPTLVEQRAIAEALSDVDELLGALEALIAKKRAIMKAAMQQLLTGRTRLPGFSGDWETKLLGEILSLIYGDSPNGIKSINGAYPIIGTGGEVGRTDQYLFDKPSIVIGRKGTIDKPQYVDTPFWAIDTTFYCDVSAYAHPKFLYYLLTTLDWLAHNEASGVPSLSAPTVQGIPVKIPPFDEQESIASVLSDMDAEIEALERRRDKTSQIKQGMMQQLLTGRVRLVEPTPEEATA